VWCRAGTNGILYDFDVYQGGNGSRSELGQGTDVVLKLTSTLLDNANYKIYADNLFTGIPLLAKLKERGLHYTGTIRKNRMAGCNLLGEKDLKKKEEDLMITGLKRMTTSLKFDGLITKL
jgi:hypothetical protein